MFFIKPRAAKSVRCRLERIAGPHAVSLLSALFEQQRHSSRGVDAMQFRIDFRDQRDIIRTLERKRFIKVTRDQEQRYRLRLIGLVLVDADRARALVATVDDLIRYFSRRYTEDRNELLSIARMSVDLGVPQETISEALGYLIGTPVVGTRERGYPNSADWWLVPVEQSLDYGNLDQLLSQLATWSEQGDPLLAEGSVSAAGLHELMSGVPSATRVDRFVNWSKDHKIVSWLLIAMIAIAAIAGALEGIGSIYEFFRSVL